MIVIICDKRGSGKTLLAPILKTLFGCKRIRDEWNPYKGPVLKDGDLALTNCPGFFVIPDKALAFTVKEALGRVLPRIFEPIW